MAAKTNPTVKVLKDARKLLAKRGGWVQGHYQSGKCGHCAMGALIAAAGKNLRARDTEDSALRNAIACHYVVVWNDMPGRTKREVLAAFDKAIKFASKADETR